MTELKITHVNPKTLKPDPKNARTHPEPNHDALLKSIREFGIRKPVVAHEKTNIVYAGNETLKCAIELGVESLPVAWIPADVSEAKCRAYAIADNRTTDLSVFDDSLLKTALDDIQFDLPDFDLTATGFSDDELEALLGGNSSLDDTEATEDDFDAEPQAEAISQTGDLWYLGNHRLICGDCTDKAVVERVIRGDKAILMATDPPYGVKVDTSWLSTLHVKRGKPANKSDDRLINDDGHLDLSFLFEYDRRMIWGFPYIFDPQATGWIVWDKQPGVDRRGIVTPVEMASTTMRKGFDIVRVMWGGYYKPSGETREAHPTQKPLGVLIPFIDEWTEKNDVIFDPFVGSGTTIIAAEQLNRQCRAIEIEPRYVDICIRRFVKYAESSDNVHCERDGVRYAFDELFPDG